VPHPWLALGHGWVCHKFLTLALLMLGVFADHTHNTTTVNDLALVTNRFYGCTNLHVISLQTTAFALQPQTAGKSARDGAELLLELAAGSY
jgi:hypothetical protein